VCPYGGRLTAFRSSVIEKGMVAGEESREEGVCLLVFRGDEVASPKHGLGTHDQNNVACHMQQGSRRGRSVGSTARDGRKSRLEGEGLGFLGENIGGMQTHTGRREGVCRQSEEAGIVRAALKSQG